MAQVTPSLVHSEIEIESPSRDPVTEQIYTDDVRSISLLHEWSDGCLYFCEVNMSNTRIATVVFQNRLSSNHSIRQQVWDSGSGELLWTYQEEFDDTNPERLNLLRPKFSPSGDHVAFFRGQMTISIVDTTSNTQTEVVKIDLDAIVPMKSGLFRTFAIGPQPNSLALVYLGDPSIRRIHPSDQSTMGYPLTGNSWAGKRLCKRLVG